MDENQLHFALGEIKGQLDGIKKSQDDHGKELKTISTRVNKNEIKAAKLGAISGTLMSGFVWLLKSSLN